MSEGVAKVVRDIKAGRAVDPAWGAVQSRGSATNEAMHKLHQDLVELVRDFPCPVIDGTPMYEQIVNMPALDIYNEFRLMPVWDNCLIGYENNFGNVYVVHVYLIDRYDDERWQSDEWADAEPPYAWETENPVEWSRVRYRFVAVLWAGGCSQGRHVPTTGPLYRWDAAVYDDGEMADLRWSELFDFGLAQVESQTITQNIMLIWLQTFTLAGCSNVELITPMRPKPERKRLERIGVVPQTIVIKKTSKSYRHHKDDTKDVIGGVPQRFVRGHYARYGAEYDRGLLFGKYSGKFWIPARAVGDSGREIDYLTE